MLKLHFQLTSERPKWCLQTMPTVYYILFSVFILAIQKVTAPQKIEVFLDHPVL